MPVTRQLTRRLRFGTLLLALGALGACGDEGTGADDDPAEEVETVQLTIGSQTVSFSGGAQTSVVSIRANAPQAVSARFLRENGTQVQLPAAQFELQIQEAGGVTFTRSGSFAGTLTATQTGTKNLAVTIYHREERHPEEELGGVLRLNVTQ